MKDFDTTDIPRAFLETKNKGEVIIRLDQHMAKQLARINPKYATDKVEKKGQPVINIWKSKQSIVWYIEYVATILERL